MPPQIELPRLSDGRLFVAPSLRPDVLRARDDDAQRAELQLINFSADLIENSFLEKNLPLPNVFLMLTAGFDEPQDAIQLGTFAEAGPFGLWMPADISGHKGTGAALLLDETHSALVMNGRAHPYAGTGKEYAEMLYARQLNTIKELMRRQRERGIESMIISTYLVGVDETSILKQGDLGVIIDHTEMAGGRTGLSAGAGPRNILDQYEGARFQPKIGRSSSMDLSPLLFRLGKERGITIGPAAVVGTIDTTSYQGLLDRSYILQSFRDSATYRALFDMGRETLGEDVEPSLFYGMAVSFEIGVIRQVLARETNSRDETQHWTEPDFNLVVIGLPTDIVGSGSAEVNHAKIVEEAFSHGRRNGDLLAEFCRRAVSQLTIERPPNWVGPISLQSVYLQEKT